MKKLYSLIFLLITNFVYSMDTNHLQGLDTVINKPYDLLSEILKWGGLILIIFSGVIYYFKKLNNEQFFFIVYLFFWLGLISSGIGWWQTTEIFGFSLH